MGTIIFVKVDPGVSVVHENALNHTENVTYTQKIVRMLLFYHSQYNFFWSPCLKYLNYELNTAREQHTLNAYTATTPCQ